MYSVISSAFPGKNKNVDVTLSDTISDNSSDSFVTAEASQEEEEDLSFVSVEEESDSGENNNRQTILDRSQPEPATVSSDFSVCVTNVDQLPNKIDELKTLIDSKKFDVILLTEVCPENSSNKLHDSHVKIPGYQVLSNLSSQGCKRGTLALAKAGYNTKIIDVPLLCPFVEAVCFDLCVPGSHVSETVRIGCIYRSPSAPSQVVTKQAIAEIICILNSNLKGHVLITGDFNLPSINWINGFGYGATPTEQDKQQPFLNCLSELSLHQIVDQPTRYRLFQRPTILDLVILNDKSLVQSIDYSPPLGKSDHLTIELMLKVKVLKNKLVKKVFVDYIAIRNELSTTDWPNVLSGTVDKQWTKFKGVLLKAQDAHTKTSFKPKPRSLPYMTKDIKREINRKKFRQSGDLQQHTKFTKARNKLRNLTRKLYENLESNLAKESKTNPKKFWNYVSSKNHSRRTISRLVKPCSTTVTNITDVANELNRHFASVFTCEPEGPLPNCPGYEAPTTMVQVSIDPSNILKRLQNLDTNKSAGPDHLHPRLLKELATIIAGPLSDLFQKSINAKSVPSDWKTAFVTPIFKKGSRLKAENYRPISLTSVVAKILERVVNDTILEHLKVNNILSPNQHGFQPGKSVETNLLETYDIITDLLDKGLPVDLVLLDFAKAFDKVPHKRLREKLTAAQLHPNLVNWLINFLSGRTQRVRLFGAGGEKVFSEPCDVISGVPQGTVLGPTLFNIYINDIFSEVENKLSLYADDSKLFGAVNVKSLQTDVQKIQLWADKFNISKCSTLHFGSSNPCAQYHMHEHASNSDPPIKTSTEERDLGVIVDSLLKFHANTIKSVSQANTNLGLIKRTVTSRSPLVFLKLYKALVRPVLDFGMCAAFPAYKGDVRLIEGVQRRATKVITNLGDKPYQDRLRALNLPTLVYRRNRSDMMMTRKLLNSSYAKILPIHPGPPQCTRGHSKKLFKQSVRTRARKSFFTNRVVNPWNELCEATVSAPTPEAFKKALDKEWATKDWKYEWDIPSCSYLL